MSATNRGSKRRTNDEYLTPIWCVSRLLEYTNQHGLLPGTTWLDPCAGNGGLIRSVKALRPDVSMMGIEIRAEAEAELAASCGTAGYMIGDALEIMKQLPDRAVDVVVTNTPFDLFMQFLAECRRVARRVVLLERINALRGDGRQAFMRETKPGMLVLPDRPSFTGWGTDATEYCWYTWGIPELEGGRYEILGDTSDDEKAAWNEWARKRFPEESPKVKALYKDFTDGQWETVFSYEAQGVDKVDAIKLVAGVKL